MEYVAGADLRELLAAAGRAGTTIPYETSISIVIAAAAGLDHAHRRCGPDGQPLRLVHRDVSLSNIMVGHDGAVKVVDFGIAQTTIATVHTSPGVVRGKASYMSPEQCLAHPVDHRTDVFALGVVLYELTTSARCFHGKTDYERMLAVVRGDYLPPSDLVASYPPELERIVRMALATDPENRFASAAAMIEALEHVMALRDWTVGPGTIVRTMQTLFGAVPGTCASPDDNAPVTEERATVFAAEPTAPARRLARGTQCDGLPTTSDDDDDVRTSSRRALRRAPLAA
jgi:serine/threonine protein kinase